MKSNNSEEKITRITELLTRLFRFCFFLIIAPFAVAFAGFWILVQFPWASYIAFAISVLIFIFALLFFYKSFDNYRSNPFFLNKSNNPIARVHIVFLISILSYSTTPIFIRITPEDYSFIYLPLISFTLIYNIVYYYYHFQPIDFYNIEVGEFKHALTYRLRVKQPYNFIIIINYFTQILFLSITVLTNLSWFFALINNIIFYLITIAYTYRQQSIIKKSIEERNVFLKPLTKFKLKFVLSLDSFIFILLIQIPIIVFIDSIQAGHYSTNLLANNSIIILLLILLFFKTLIYTFLYYNTLLGLYFTSETLNNFNEIKENNKIKFQKLNSILTGLFILFITLYGFLINLTYITLIAIPFFYFFSYYEHKSKYCYKKYNKYIILSYSLALLASISFGILPALSDLINFNVQLIVFSTSLYFILEILRRLKYFKKENTLLTQNILAVINFFLIIFNYIIITTDPYIALISNVFLILIFFFIALLISFYRLYAIFFYKKYTKAFKICVLFNLFLIEFSLFFLINFQFYFSVSFNTFLNILILSTILFPIIFILFVTLNYLLQIIPYKTYLASTYNSLWVLWLSIFLSIFFNFFANYIMIIFDFLLLLILITLNLRFGLKIEKIKEKTYQKANNLLSYPIFILLLTLIFSIFYSSLQILIIIENIMISSILTLIITCVIINYFSNRKLFFTKVISIWVNFSTLVSISFLLFYYLLKIALNVGTYYIYTFPIIIPCIWLYLPFFYLLKISFATKLVKKILLTDSIILSVLLFLIPTFIYLELIKIGVVINTFTIISVLNFSLYILFGILVVYLFSLKENLKIRIRKSLVLIAFFLTGTTVFYYFFIIFSKSLFIIIFPLIIASCYFFLPSIYSYKKRLLNETIAKRIIKINSIILSVLLFLIPTFIFLELIERGAIINTFSVITVLNFSLYILFGVFVIYLFKLKDYFKTLIQKLLVIIAFLLTGTTVFYYFFFLFSESFYIIILPLIMASCYFFLPTIYSYKKRFLNETIAKTVIIINSILLMCLILSVPTLIGLELKNMGIEIDWILVSFLSSLILFVSLGVFDSMITILKISKMYNQILRFIQIFVWILISSFISFEILSLTFLEVKLLGINLSILTILSLNVITLKLIEHYSKDLNLIKYLQAILYYGIVFSLSFVLFSLFFSFEIFNYLPKAMQLFNVLWGLGILLLPSFTIFKLSSALIESKFPKFHKQVELISWVITKIAVCFFTSLILIIYVSTDYFSVFNIIITFILIFLLLSPITISYFENFKSIFEENKLSLQKFSLILFLIDLLSFISYMWLFNFPIYGSYNLILTITLTLSFSAFSYIILYNKLPIHLRNLSFLIALPSIVISFPIFLYFFISLSFSIPFGDPIPIIIVMYVGLFLFYLSIGIYQWRISWAIWKTGWYAWLILPFLNAYVAYRSFSGIDIITNALDFFTYDVEGSFIFAFTIFFLSLLPILYTKIKEFFYQILLFIWGTNLFLLYWISQNLFLTNLLLRNLIFTLFALVLLMPVFYRLKLWKIISILWLILIAVNANFLIFYLISLNIPLEIAISIDVCIIGFLFLIFSFFPTFKSIKNVILISSYLVIIIGIFLTIYFLLYNIILNPIFSLNLAFLIIGFSLFTSKFIKPIKRVIDIISSWILIFSVSWLTFTSFNLFPNLFFFALFSSIAVWGGSFFILNRYKMKIPLNKLIPFLMFSLGTSLAISSILVLLLPKNPYIITSIFVIINLLFMYSILDTYRMYLWYLIPLPFSFLFQEVFLLIEIVHASIYLAFLIFLIQYIIFFQILVNIANHYFKGSKIETENKLSFFFRDKNQIKLNNLICFIVNSIYLSILISIISTIIYEPFLFKDLKWIYNIINILIFLPFFLLFCIRYIVKSELELKVNNLLIYFHKISFFLYLVIPSAISIDFFFILLKLHANLIYATFLIILIFNGVLFLELSVFDNRYFYYLFVRTRNKLLLSSWVVFCNLFCIFLYLFHLNEFFLILSISVINLFDLYFLSNLNVEVRLIRSILIYNAFIWLSLFIASLISDRIIYIFEELRGIPNLLLFLHNSTFLLFVFSNFIKKAKKDIKFSVELFLILLFQGIFVINWINIFLIYEMLNLFSIYFIILVETCLSFITIKLIDNIFIRERFPDFLVKTNSLIIFLLYLEISLVVYGLAIEFLGLFESILISQVILFALISSDLFFMKKIKEKYGRLIHTISYFIISLTILLILNQLVKGNPLLINLVILFFVLMQFYTNHSLFILLFSIYSDKTETLKGLKIKVYHALGVFFYLSIFSILLQSLLLIKVEISVLILVLSLFVHGLMILDNFLFKFLGKSANYVKAFSWILFIIFSFFSILSFYIAYLSDILISSIPLLILIFVIEFVYLIKTFEFLPKIKLNKDKVRKGIIPVIYFDLVAWPLFFMSINILVNINLIFCSFLILLIILYSDEYFHIFKEKSLKKVRFSTWLVITIIISMDVFIWLELSSHLSLSLNFCISLLTFLILSYGLFKPYKRSPLISFIYWAIIFLIVSLIIYFASFQEITSVIFFFITLGLYPFIFMFEELKKLFNKLIDILLHFFKQIKDYLKLLLIKIFNFLKLYFRFIWILISCFISISIGVFLSPLQLNYLNWYHSIFVILGLFGALTLVIPSRKSGEIDVIFKERIRKLITSWGTVIAILFLFITPIWYIFAFWISIWILGAILLPYIIYKERKDNISVKWRFYTLIIIIIILIIIGIPAILSVLKGFKII